MVGCMGSGSFQHGATVRMVLSCPILPVRTRLTALNHGGIERNSLSVRNTHLALAAASARMRPCAMHSPIGFSQATSLPAWIAARAMGTCQWSGVVIITASTSLRASTSRKSVVRKQACIVSRSMSCCFATATAAGFSCENSRRQRSTSHRATTCASAARANTGRLCAIACRPRPIIPTPMRLLGATVPFAPRRRGGNEMSGRPERYSTPRRRPPETVAVTTACHVLRNDRGLVKTSEAPYARALIIPQFLSAREVGCDLAG